MGVPARGFDRETRVATLGRSKWCYLQLFLSFSTDFPPLPPFLHPLLTISVVRLVLLPKEMRITGRVKRKRSFRTTGLFMVSSTTRTRATRSRTLCFTTLSPPKSESDALPSTCSMLRYIFFFAVSSTHTCSCESSREKTLHLFSTFPRRSLSATLLTLAAGMDTGSPTPHRRGGFMVQRL